MVLFLERLGLMKKKSIFFILAVLFLVAALVPGVSLAAVTPHFVAVNDTLLPFNADTMPFIRGGVVYVPYGVLAWAGVRSSVSAELGRVRLQMGGTKWVDLYPASGAAVDQNGDALDWPATQRSDGRNYVPLQEICSYFSFRYELIEVGRYIIPDTQIWVIRIITGSVSNRQDFVDRNAIAMLSTYNNYYGNPSSPSDPDDPTPPVEEPPPTYSDVTVYFSFHDLVAGNSAGVMSLLESQLVSGLRACFFVSAGDIKADPGLVRLLCGSGHTVGIWLESGTLGEYLEASALLFEAAKAKTVLISSAGRSTASAAMLADVYGLIFWGAAPDIEPDEESDEWDITDTLPTESGERVNLSFDCSEDAVAVLPGLLLHLRTYEYAIGTISETTIPVR